MQRKKQAKTWIKTTYPGIFYRETIDKDTGNVVDHYYTGHYSCGGKRFQCVFGSKKKHGWTPKKCADKMSEFRGNALEGKKPRDFKEERELNEKKEAEEAAAAEAQKKLEITLAEFWENKYLPNEQSRIKDGSKKPKSVKDETSIYNNWLEPLLGETPLIHIDFNSLLDLKKAMLDKELSMRSVQYCLAVLRQVFNFAISTGDYHEVNPVTRHKKRLEIKVNNARKQWFTIPEFEIIKAELQKRNPTAYTLALLGFNTGGRLNEVYQLKWDSIDFEKKFVHFRADTTKTGEDRYIPLNTELLTHLQNIYTKENPDPEETIIKNMSGKPVVNVSDNTLTNIFINVLEDTGLRVKKSETMSYHHLRHSFGSILAQSGEVTLHELRDLMGHATIQMTMRYAKLMKKDQKLIKKMDVLSQQEPESETNDFLVLLWAVFGCRNRAIENQDLPDNVIKLKKA